MDPKTNVCPSCGHELTMFSEAAPSRGEALAGRIAGVVASWPFVLGLLSWIAIWVLVNVLFRPFEPYPMAMIAGLAASLSTVAALQGPLILLSQRSAAARDRERDREAFRVATHAEADIHQLQRQLDRISEQLLSGEAPQPDPEENQS